MCVFQFITYQNTKTHAKYPLWRNKITLPKNCHFKYFELVTYKNTKIHAKYLIWETKGHYDRIVLLLFLSFLGIKTLKRMNNTLFSEKKRTLPNTCIFFVLKGTKTLKYMQSTICRKEISRNLSLVCF